MNDMLEIDEDDFYCLDEEGLSLTDEQIAEAVKISNLVIVQSSKWQVYLNALARSGFSNWLEDRDDDLFSQLRYSTPAIDNLQVGEFKVCIIAIGSTDEDFISIPQSILKNPNEVAHFYVIVRVLEEINQTSIHGFIRYDQLKVRRVEDFLDGTCDFPIEWLTLDPDELLSYLRCLNPGAILLPTPVTAISKWLKGVIQTGWQTIEQIELLVNTPTFAFRSPVLQYATRSRQSNAIELGKVIDLRVGSEKISVALVIDVTPIPNGEEFDIWTQLYPIDRDVLLPDIQLSILENSGEVFRKTISGNEDRFIQLNFTASISEEFAIKIEFSDTQIVEHCVV
jgi:hypothetical protein